MKIELEHDDLIAYRKAKKLMGRKFCDLVPPSSEKICIEFKVNDPEKASFFASQVLYNTDGEDNLVEQFEKATGLRACVVNLGGLDDYKDRIVLEAIKTLNSL